MGPKNLDHDGLWVQIDRDSRGRYVPVVGFGRDVAVPMTGMQARDYAVTVLTAAAHAAHDAAVTAQMTLIDITAEAAALMVHELRRNRTELRPDATHPFRFVPGVSAFTKEPFLHVLLRGRAVGQLTPSAATDHALYVLLCAASAPLDAAYYKRLSGLVGDPSVAAHAVNNLDPGKWIR